MILNRIKLDPDPDPELSIVEKYRQIKELSKYLLSMLLCWEGDTKEYSK